jgi:hypothetical protein
MYACVDCVYGLTCLHEEAYSRPFGLSIPEHSRPTLPPRFWLPGRRRPRLTFRPRITTPIPDKILEMIEPGLMAHRTDKDRPPT